MYFSLGGGLCARKVDPSSGLLPSRPAVPGCFPKQFSLVLQLALGQLIQVPGHRGGVLRVTLEKKKKRGLEPLSWGLGPYFSGATEKKKERGNRESGWRKRSGATEELRVLALHQEHQRRRHAQGWVVLVVSRLLERGYTWLHHRLNGRWRCHGDQLGVRKRRWRLGLIWLGRVIPGLLQGANWGEQVCRSFVEEP